MIRMFAMTFGAVYLIVGILGFVPSLTPHSPDMHPLAVETAHGRLMGLFPVNLLHNIAHIGIGLWGIIAAGGINAARFYAQAIAILYALLAVMGLIPGLNTTFGLIPIYGHDVWLHAASALVAAYFGFVARHGGASATV